MAKKHKRDAKHGRIKLPKKIGKVKLPKELRQSGERLIESGIEALRDAATRELAVAGIAAMVANASRTRAAADPVPPPRTPEPPTKMEARIIDNDGTPRVDPDQLVTAIGAAATQALRELLRPRS